MSRPLNTTASPVIRTHDIPIKKQEPLRLPAATPAPLIVRPVRTPEKVNV